MKTTSLKALTFGPILLFCSCSNVSDTAQALKTEPAASQVSRKTEKNVPPAAVLLQSKELFGSMKFKSSEFAEDSLLETQDSFGELDTDGTLKFEQTDFSQDIIP